MQKRVLGLDLGIDSIGWAVVDLDEELFDSSEKNKKYAIRNGEIVSSGVRIFKQPIDRQKKSLALIRGEARRSRASTERRSERLKHFIDLSKQIHLISDNFSVEQFKQSKPEKVWELRKCALDEKLSNIEFFQVLYHIAKHRGFYFLTKEERNEMGSEQSIKNENHEDTPNNKEKGKVKAGLLCTKAQLQNSGYRTIGEYLYYKEGKKHNSADQYDICIRREDLIDEVNKIFKSQQERGNNLLTEDFRQRYIDEVLMYNHPIDENKFQNMFGKCELDGNICFPQEGYSAELFSCYNRLNNLKINNEDLNKTLKDAKTRNKILEFALQHEKVTFSDLRHNILLLSDENVRFNLCSYREYNPEVEKSITIKPDKIPTLDATPFIVYNREGEIIDDEANRILQEIRRFCQNFFEKHPSDKNIKLYYSDIRKMVKLSDEFRFQKLKKEYCLSKEEIGTKKYLNQFEKDVFFSFSGYHKLKKHFGNDFQTIANPQTLDDIAEILAYYKNDQTRKEQCLIKGINDETTIDRLQELNMKGVSNFSRTALQNLNQYMDQGLLYEDAKKAAGYIKQTTEKSNFIEEYHGFFEKNPVVARIIGQFRKVMNAIIRQYGTIDEIHIELATDVANSQKKIDKIRNGQQRYKEQRDAARERCIEFKIDPDKGDNLLRFRLAEEQDWRCVYSNKGIWPDTPDKTPSDKISIFDCDIDHIIPISRSFDDSLNNKVLCTNSENRQKTNMIPMEYFKTSNLKTENDLDLFIDRVKNNNKMSYAKKGRLLRESFTAENMEKFISRDLVNTRYASRHIAEYLRKYFDFSSSQCSYIPDINRIRVLGGGITAKLRHFWGLEKDRDESNKHHAQDAIVIACASYGHIYYICSILKKLEEQGKGGRNIPAPWENFRNEVQNQLDNIFVSKMIRCGATGQVHKQPNKATKGGTPISRERTGEEFYASLDSMFRYDIYKHKGHYYCVPIYAIDLAGTNNNPKPFEHKVCPPQKGCPEFADEKDFVFSLYKDCYVEITTTDNETYCGYISQYVAQSGQFYLDSPNGDYAYEINTSTLKIGDFIKLNNHTYQINSFDATKSVLEAISNDEQTQYLNATPKGKDTYKTDSIYIKVDKEKKVSISTFKDLKKYQIGILGEKVLIKKEHQRFTNHIKPNSVRHKERLEKRQQKQNKE